jgi:hypothetical protein
VTEDTAFTGGRDSKCVGVERLLEMHCVRESKVGGFDSTVAILGMLSLVIVN